MSFSFDIAQQLRASLPNTATTITDPQCLQYLKDYRSLYELKQIKPANFIWRLECDISTRNHPSTQATELVIHSWLTHITAPTLFIVHGFLDHTGLYKKAIKWGLTQQLNVVIFDLPGHGLSSGDPASIDSFDQYSQALLAVIDACTNEPTILTDPNKLYSLSQSTGSAVVANTTLFFRKNLFSHNIMLAPLVRSHHWAQLRWYYFFLRFFKQHMPRRFSRCSHDRRFLDFVKFQDPLQSQQIPTAWLGAMEQWHQKIKQATTTNQALTIIQGSNDTTVDWRYNTALLNTVFKEAKQYMIEGANHHLINESDFYWEKAASIMALYVKHPKLKPSSPNYQHSQ